MGYWVTIYLIIALEEHFLFRRKSGFDRAAWNDGSTLPTWSGSSSRIYYWLGWFYYLYVPARFGTLGLLRRW